MSHFAYYYPGGVVAANTVIPHGWFQYIEQNLFKALNADDGGTWAPSSVITIGGQGLTLTGRFEIDGGAFNYATFNANAIFNYSAGFYSSVAMNAGLTVSAAFPLTVAGNAAIAGSLSVGGVASFAANTSCHNLSATSLSCTSAVNSGSLTTGSSSADALLVEATSTFNAPVNIVDGGSLSAAITTSGAGRVRQRVTSLATVGANSSAYGPSNADVVIVQAMSAAATFTINDTDGQDGDVIRFVNNDTANFLTINDPIHGTFIALKSVSGQSFSVLCMRVGGRYRTISYDQT